MIEQVVFGIPQDNVNLEESFLAEDYQWKSCGVEINFSKYGWNLFNNYFVGTVNSVNNFLKVNRCCFKSFFNTRQIVYQV